MSEDRLEIKQRLKDDFWHYAVRCLKIRTKASETLPFNLNRVQNYIHQRLEEQREKTGRVRAIILKGRQQGCSTYVEGRFYWRVTHTPGARAFILTHEQAATDNLFDMVSRYHENCPSQVKPRTGASSAKELSFDRLDSGYKVGTAGTKAVGRSSTFQLFHGSEVAFWPNAQDHAAGVLQAVPDEAGTEVILESTANGIGNYYHTQWQDAEAGLSDFIAVFIPWYWQEEYSREPGENFTLSTDEVKYQEEYGLNLGQIAWRRAKIIELGSGGLFRQEYPATAAEAFQSSGDGYILPEIVMGARKAKAVERFGPVLIGVDPSAGRTDKADRTAIIRRQGRVAYGLETMTKLGPLGTMQIVARIIAIINQERPDKVFLDRAGLGVGILDRLHELGYGDVVVGVNGGDAASDPKRWKNKKAEMWDTCYTWLKDQPCQIPDSDELHADLTGIQGGWDSNSCLVMETNEHLASRKIRSPDTAVALCLTHSYPMRLEMSSAPLTTPQEDWLIIQGQSHGGRAVNLE